MCIWLSITCHPCCNIHCAQDKYHNMSRCIQPIFPSSCLMHGRFGFWVLIPRKGRTWPFKNRWNKYVAILEAPKLQIARLLATRSNVSSSWIVFFYVLVAVSVYCLFVSSSGMTPMYTLITEVLLKQGQNSVFFSANVKSMTTKQPSLITLQPIAWMILVQSILESNGEKIPTWIIGWNYRNLQLVIWLLDFHIFSG